MLDVIYEDNHIIVAIKPQNVPSQADASLDDNMVSIAKRYLKQKYDKPGNVYLGLVHRLDRPTGGLMVFAKTGKAAKRLSESIRTNKFNKVYLCVVNGVVADNKGRLVNYLKKHARTNVVEVVPQFTTGAKRAELEYIVLDRKQKVTLLAVKLKTGRSHQIRVQLKHIGHAIYGDVKYGGDILAKGHNLALWAHKLEFEHPTKKESSSYAVFPPSNVPWNVFDIEMLVSRIKFESDNF